MNAIFLLVLTALFLENTKINTAMVIPIPAIRAPTKLAEVNPNPMAMGNPAKNAPEALPILKALWFMEDPNISDPLDALIMAN